MNNPTKFLDIANESNPFELENGRELSQVRIAYKTWGELNKDRSNAILVFHALTGSHHASGVDQEGPGTRLWKGEVQKGWWDDFLGPGKAVDTNKFFVICCNYLGGCYGSTGPADINPETGKPYGGDFPFPTVSDIVNSQLPVLEHLGIEKLLAIVGGSVGGFMAVDFAIRFPDRVHTVIPVATGLRATVLQKALNFEQIFAIGEDSNYNHGNYYDDPLDEKGRQGPWRGLALARMISHKTFVSLRVMEKRAKDTIIQPEDVLSGHSLEHKIESYLMHQGRKFVERFDANSYLRIINAWQSFDLPAKMSGKLDRVSESVVDVIKEYKFDKKEFFVNNVPKMLEPCQDQYWMLFSIDSDVCFYPNEQKEISAGLKANDIRHLYITVNSDKGHDSFLLEPDLFSPHIKLVLEQTLAEI